jgi:hypothetical protein
MFPDKKYGCNHQTGELTEVQQITGFTKGEPSGSLNARR